MNLNYNLTNQWKEMGPRFLYRIKKTSKSLFAINRTVVILLITLGLFSPLMAKAQDAETEKLELIKSMGFPPSWKPYAGGLLGWGSMEGRTEFSGEFYLGVFKDLVNPVLGVLGVVGEGYVRGMDGEMDGGLRLLGASRLFFLQAGVDYSFRNERLDFLLSFTLPIKRGGIFGRGSVFRFDIVPSRSAFSFGINIPLSQPYLGRTRPKKIHVDLPQPPRTKKSLISPQDELIEPLENVKHSAEWIKIYTTPFFDQKVKKSDEHLDAFRSKVLELKKHLATKDKDFPEGHTFEAEIRHYHRELERAFTIAAGNLPDMGARVAAKSREVLLNEVIIPYNRHLGQTKSKDTILGYGAHAEKVFNDWVNASLDIPKASRETVEYVFRKVIQFIEQFREGSLKVWKDTRLVWLPFHYALRLEDRDTQEELDHLLEKAVGVEFTEGNDAYYLIGEQFQWELARMIQAAEDYHVLWIHDIRGYDSEGEPDEVAFNMSLEVYLRTLIQKVKAYDRTGKMPVYMIFLDQLYFEMNKSSLWLRFLEDPLEHELKLPEGHKDWENRVRAEQKELLAAVTTSEALQAGAKRYGKKWLKDKVKVHIFITNPADFSFRNSQLLGIPLLPDNLIRDHRKISFYDITELDPAKGEALYTGEGVGEHYSGPHWDDRAILTRGPAVLDLKNAIRELLFSQGYKPHEIPSPLRPMDLPPDYPEKVEALKEKGWMTEAFQSHNATGFGLKKASLVKALLYDLMPHGSHYYLPDSLWNSPFWAGMVVGAALRGNKVLVISPSAANAPSNAPMTLSRTNEIFTRLVIIHNELGDAIKKAGGLLKIGVYHVDVGVKDQIGRIKLVSKNLEKYTWLREEFPFPSTVFEEFHSLPDYMESQGYKAAYLTESEKDDPPKLHLKSQFFASDEALRDLIPQYEWAELFRDYILAREDQYASQSYVDSKKLRARLRGDIEILMDEWKSAQTPDDREKTIFYLIIGSQNQDLRSKLVDGEALYTMNGIQSLIGYLDHFFLIALCTWVETVEELEELLPHYTGFWYNLGRALKINI